MLKYAAEYLDLSEEDMMYVPVDDFDDGVEGMCLFFLYEAKLLYKSEL